MRHRGLCLSALALLAGGCSALGQREAEKPPGTSYSAAFIKSNALVIFPFGGNEVTINLPATLGGMTYSANGQTIYGVASLAGVPRALVATRIKAASVHALPGSSRFSSLISLAVNAPEDEAIVSATYDKAGIRRCGLFKLDLGTGNVEHIVDNLGGTCVDFLKSWSNLSLSPDGVRAVGTRRKGEIALVNLKTSEIERLWAGTAASWSPDGKWIATLSYGSPMRLELIDASNFSKRRELGTDSDGRLQWSPDSRYLLVWKTEQLCGMGAGYFGTLYALDIGTGRMLPIKSSTCRVNLLSAGWVSDDVLR